MPIKVMRTVFRNLLSTGLGNPVMFLMPMIILIAALPLITSFNPDDYVPENAPEEIQDEIEQTVQSTSLLLTILLPILLIGITLPVFLSGIAGRPNVMGVIKTANIERRMEKLKKLGAAQFVSQTEARLIDSSPRGNKLYTSNIIIPGKPVHFLIYQDRSTDREYISFVENRYHNADEAMASKFRLSSIEYEKLKVENEA